MKLNWIIPLFAAAGLALAGCGGGGSPQQTGEVQPTPYEAAKMAIASAATAEEAQAAYDAVKDDVTAAEGEQLQAAVDARVDALAMMAREMMQKTALMTAAGDVDTSDLSTPEAIAAANTAIAALQAALDAADDVSDADKAMYQSQLDAAEMAVETAQAALDLDGRMTAQRMAISNAATAAQTAVAGVGDDSTDSEVTAADAAVKAVKDAIAAADDLAADDSAIVRAQGVLAAIEPQLAAAKTSRTEAMAAADEQMRKDMAATGKAMHAALAGPGTDMNALDNVTNSSIVSQGLRLTVPADAGAITGAVDKPVTIQTGESAGALGSWNGTDYMHTNTGTKVVNEARVYNNKGAGKSVTFAAAGYTVAEATSGTDIKGYLTLDAADAATLGRIMAPTFTHSGTQTHSIPSRNDALYVRGTYDGAPGEYRCTGVCSSTNDGRGSPSALGGTTWHFKPDAGAMVMQPDDDYLYFGWWVNKDKDGVPKVASAFAGIVGDVDGDTTTTGGRALTGSATYAGPAVGKFAMTNVLDSTGNGGHFTANAMLNAIFGDPGAGSPLGDIGITGTIDNFRLNDGSEDAGWRVELKRAGFDAGANTFGGTGNEAATVWSINGNKAAESGGWSGQMYDEMPGDPPNGDGSTVPTTVTGTFYSEFSTVGRMVGAFGANKQ